MNVHEPEKDLARDPRFEALFEAPHRFEALTAIRLAEAEARRRNLTFEVTAPPTGALAATPISVVKETPTAIRVEAQFAGLVGPLSPLPPAWTELAAADRRRRAGGLAAFLDLFSGRLALLFARAAAKYDLPVLLQWAPRRFNRILGALNALVGLMPPGDAAAEHRPAAPLPGDETLAFAGILANRTRSAVGLQAIAETHLGLPVRVEQFHRRWRPIPLSEQTPLDGSRTVARDAIAGARIPDRSGQVRLVIGPVRYPDFQTLEPGQPRLRSFARLIQFAIGPVLDFDIQIILDRRDVPETQLSRNVAAPRLGWNGWALRGPASRDSQDAIIDGRRAAT